MSKSKGSAAKGCAILAAIVVGIPLLMVGVVGVKTWLPLRAAGDALDQLDQSLGQQAIYHPAPSGEILAERMELFLELRTELVAACDDYGTVQKGFDLVAELETKDSSNPSEVGDVASGLGGAALSITPFLARYFEMRNDALLAAAMGLQEYSYIYAVAYHDLLLSERTRIEIFSDGNALSPAASVLLQGCLARQSEALGQAGGDQSDRIALETE
ncbi:MAG: hypothetical protein ACTSQ7_17690, partial [Alphaproteobacteria bacterium]